jgi:hypothetical protein
MTRIGTHIAAILAAGTLAAGAVLAAEASTGERSTPPTAVVIDASLAHDGRALVDSRLEGLDAEVRLPRDADEARTNVRYFDALDYHVYVAGATATAAADRTGVPATRLDGLAGALRVAR